MEPLQPQQMTQPWPVISCAPHRWSETAASKSRGLGWSIFEALLLPCPASNALHGVPRLGLVPGQGSFRLQRRFHKRQQLLTLPTASSSQRTTMCALQHLTVPCQPPFLTQQHSHEPSVTQHHSHNLFLQTSQLISS